MKVIDHQKSSGFYNSFLIAPLGVPKLTTLSARIKCKRTMTDYPAFFVSTAPEFHTLSRLLDNVDAINENRLAVFVRVTLPYNSSARLDPAYDCQFMFFADARNSITSLVREARAVCCNVHNTMYQRERHVILRNSDSSPAAMRRCCQIKSSASRWLFYDHTSRLPLLPRCKCTQPKAGDDGTSTDVNLPLECGEDKHTSNNDVDADDDDDDDDDDDECDVDFVDEKNADGSPSTHECADKMYEKILHYHRVNDTDRATVLATLPENERLSHFGQLCLYELEAAMQQITECIAEHAADDESPLCFGCDLDAAKLSSATTAKYCRSDRLCTSCLEKLLRDMETITAWAIARGVVCTRRQSCSCIYTYAVRSSTAIVRLDAVVDATDPAYEYMHDSIYDPRSPLLISMIQREDKNAGKTCIAGGILRQLTTRAKLPRVGGNNTVHQQQHRRTLRSSDIRDYTFGERLSYADMLREARRVYAQPDAQTLSEIAILNNTVQPLIDDAKVLRAAQQWLPPAVARRMELHDPRWLRPNAVNSIILDKFLFAPVLEEVLYNDISCAPNCRLAFARFASFIVPWPRTSRQHRASSVYFAALLAIVAVCENTAERVQEETAARVISQMKFEAAQLQEREAAQRQQRRRDETNKRNRSNSNNRRVQAGTQRKASSSPPSKKISYASQRVLAHSREPRIGFEQLRIVSMSPNDLQQSIDAVKSVTIGTIEIPYAALVTIDHTPSPPPIPAAEPVIQVIAPSAAPSPTKPPIVSRIKHDVMEFVPARKRSTPSPHIVCGIIATDHCAHLLGSDLFSTIFAD